MFKVQSKLLFRVILFVGLIIYGCGIFCQVLDTTKPSYIYSNPRTHHTNFSFECNYGSYSDSLEKIIKQKKLPRKIRNYLKEMIFINGGYTVIKNVNWLIPTEKDTTLLFYNHDKQIYTNSFMLGKNEVTNKEYREFIYWVRDSIARSILAERNTKYFSDSINKILNWKIPVDWNDSILESGLYLDEYHRFYRRKEFDSRKLIYKYVNDNENITQILVYPDTMRWVDEFQYAFNEPMTQMYFWHPAYDNYPVVGVTYNQSVAYCHWKTEQMQKKLSSNNDLKNIFISYRLPTELEWDYAAIGQTNKGLKKKTVFPWNDEVIISHEGKYYANSGTTLNKNDFAVKYFDDDGFFHTSPVGHFSENELGLYDMAGNVAEWTEDKAHEISLKDYFDCYPYDDSSLFVGKNTEISEADNIHTLLRKIVDIKNEDSTHELDIDTFYCTTNEKIRYDVQNMLHDYEVIKNTIKPHIVKGGSWADPSTYLLVCMNQVYAEDSSSCKIGFRLAMSIPDVWLPYVYSSKYLGMQNRKIEKNIKNERKKRLKIYKKNHTRKYDNIRDF